MAPAAWSAYRKLTCTYHGIERNNQAERAVKPYGLLFKHSH